MARKREAVASHPRPSGVGGAAAREWGLRTARALARELGATAPAGGSNECLLDGARVVIKCAAPATWNVGVTPPMLGRIDAVVGAFQRGDGAFDVWSLAAPLFKDHMRGGRRIRLVNRDVFEAKGEPLGRVRAVR